VTDVNNAGHADNSYVNRGGGRKVATTACRELGYKWGKEFNTSAGSEFPIVVDSNHWQSYHDQGCTGLETSFKNCARIRFGGSNCGHTEDVGIELASALTSISRHTSPAVTKSRSDRALYNSLRAPL
jgi:hypothetical protein